MNARALADAVLLVHFGVVIFVVGGLVAIVLGNRRRWRWVNRPLFRLPHLAAIGVIVAQAWLGRLCPLTILESSLRGRAGDVPYPGSFIAHWVAWILYYDLPPAVFTGMYTLFGAVVAWAWWRYPPQRTRHRRRA